MRPCGRYQQLRCCWESLTLGQQHCCCMADSFCHADGWIFEHAEGWIFGQAEGWIFEHAEGWIFGHADGWIFGHADGWIFEHADGWIFGHAGIAHVPLHDARCVVPT